MEQQRISDTYLPHAREQGLVVEPIDDELLVFDKDRQVAHSLNPTAAKVWQACDGRRDIQALVTHCELDEPTLMLALENLDGVQLLEHAVPQRTAAAAVPEAVSRRAMLRRTVLTGAGVGIAIPVIRSIGAPSIALAGSTFKNPKNNTACTNASKCSPGSICNDSNGRCARPAGASCHFANAGVDKSVCFSCGGPGMGTCSCPPDGVCAKPT